MRLGTLRNVRQGGEALSVALLRGEAAGEAELEGAGVAQRGRLTAVGLAYGQEYELDGVALDCERQGAVEEFGGTARRGLDQDIATPLATYRSARVNQAR